MFALAPALAAAIAIYLALAVMGNFTRRLDSSVTSAGERTQQVRVLDRPHRLPAVAPAPPPAFRRAVAETPVSDVLRPLPVLELELADTRLPLQPLELEPLGASVPLESHPREAVSP